MAGLWRSYLRVLNKYPWRTTCATTGTLMMAGDGISQLVVEKTELRDYDLARSARFLVFGTVVIGPALRGWYMNLDRLFIGKKAAPIKMMLADQSFFAPQVLMVFLTGMAAFRGDSFHDIKQKVKQDYLTILMTNYKVWPAAQLINFYLIPLQHRVLFVNFVALGWNTYMAWMSEKK
ncbi:protein Mpv17-like [Haliotis rufescens]|uniref:protein Mpv17-like n=2 Tax=Haliotis rufescens TaxID=6454 RepID=UPI001EAFBA06|nr:protein Mpv17-like [Haliotis rufescens]